MWYISEKCSISRVSTYRYIVEAHCHVVALEMGEFVSNSRGIECETAEEDSRGQNILLLTFYAT